MVEAFATNQSLTTVVMATCGLSAALGVAWGHSLMTGETGTVRWMAPEAFRGDPYSLKVDRYSWAMVAWFALRGQAPYAEKTLKDLRRTHLELHDRPPLKGRPTNSGVASLLSLAWAEAPGDRPEAASLSRALAPFSVALPSSIRRQDLVAPNRSGGLTAQGPLP